MDIFTSLLDSYSKLRKRRYSLSEALLFEQETWDQLQHINQQFPDGDYQIEQLQALLQSINSPAPGEPTTAYQAAEDPEGMGDTLRWIDNQGAPHSSDGEQLRRYLELRLKEEGAADGLPAEEGAPVEGELQPPSLEEQAAFSIMRFSPKLQRLAKSAGLDFEDADVEASLNSVYAGLSDGISKVKMEGEIPIVGEGGGRSTFGQLVRDTFGVKDEEYGEEAVKQFVSDFGELLDVLQDAVNESKSKDCVQVAGVTVREKMLNRFFLRGKGKKLVYGALGGAEKPLLSAGLASGRTFAPRSDKYGGTHFARNTLSLGRGQGQVDNPIVSIVNAAREIKRCESGESLIMSTNQVTGSDYAGARAGVDETAPILADHFVTFSRLPDSERKESLRGDLVAAVALSVEAIKNNIENFVDLVRDAYGYYDGIEKFTPDALEESQEFLDHVFGHEEVMTHLSDSKVDHVARLIFASYMVPELKLAARLRKEPGFIRSGVEIVDHRNPEGVSKIHKVKGFVSPDRLGGRGGSVDSPDTRTHESIKGDSYMMFDNMGSLKNFLHSQNSTYTPSMLRAFMEVPGGVILLREHKNHDPGTEDAPIQFGRASLSAEDNRPGAAKLFSPEGDQVFNTHLTFLKEKDVNPEVISKMREGRDRDKSLLHRVTTAFKATSPLATGMLATDYEKDPNTVQSIVRELEVASVSHPLADHLVNLKDRLADYLNDPFSPKAKANRSKLEAESWNLLGSLNEQTERSREDVSRRAVGLLLQTGASTHEKFISIKVGARGDMALIPQSVAIHDLAANVLNGHDEGITIDHDPTGYKFRRDGKTVAEIRIRGYDEDQRL